MREITKGINKYSSAHSDTGTWNYTGTTRVKEDIIKKHLAHCIFWVIHKRTARYFTTPVGFNPPIGRIFFYTPLLIRIANNSYTARTATDF